MHSNDGHDRQHTRLAIDQDSDGQRVENVAGENACILQDLYLSCTNPKHSMREQTANGEDDHLHRSKEDERQQRKGIQWCVGQKIEENNRNEDAHCEPIYQTSLLFRHPSDPSQAKAEGQDHKDG